MKRKIITIAISIGIIIIAALIVSTFSTKNKHVEDNAVKINANLIQITKPTVEDISYDLKATGKLTATERLRIFSEVNGQLLNSANLFKEGKYYHKGQTLLQVDKNEFKMTLWAKKSDFINLITSILPDLKLDYADSYQVWRDYVINLDPQKELAQLPKSKSTKEKFFLAGKSILSTYYNIKSAEEKLSKYTIVAPYDGIVTKSSAEAGEAVHSGSELGTFINPNKFELKITLPLSSMVEVKKGTIAKLYSSEINGTWQGKVIRVGGDIDELSQSVVVYISVSGKNLKEGMFLTASIRMSPFKNAMSVSRKLVDDNNKIFIMKDGVLRHKQVTVLIREGDKAIIKGLDANTKIMTTIIKNAYDGMPVRTNK